MKFGFIALLPFVVLPDGLPICAPDFKFAVVDADPRRLVLRADHVACSFIVSVLHAPCLGKTKGNGHRPIDDIDVWWQETSRILDACEKATYHWICVDANAPLASHPTPCFDMAHAEPTNPQGALFETFLLRHDFAVPATFSDFHKRGSLDVDTFLRNTMSQRLCCGPRFIAPLRSGFIHYAYL